METTKEKILNASVSFLKNNIQYEQLTLIKIAQAADIGKSTVYDYFNSKEELVEQTMFYLLKKYEKILFEDILTDDFEKEFSKQIFKLVNIYKEASVIADTLWYYPNKRLIESEKIKTTISYFQDKFFQRLEEIFQLAVKENKIKNLNQDNYETFVVSSIINGLIYQYTHQKMDIELKELIELIKKHCFLVLNKENPI